MSVITVNTEQEFNDLKLNFAPPFVIDFYADWCGPCKAIAPIFETISDTVEATFVKLNVDNCGEIAKKYGVRNIPTIIVLRDFEQPPVDYIIGMKTQTQLTASITEAVNVSNS